MQSVPQAVPLPQAFLAAPIAHRGLHDLAANRPENSLSAFLAAVQGGYGIELDVQRSADGVAMVFHDGDLDRVSTGIGPLAAKTAVDLTGIRLKGSGEAIPTLAQVLEQVRGRVPVLIEIKEGLATMAATPGILEAAVAATLAGYSGPVAVMSFNPHCLAHLARLAPEVPRGLTTGAYRPEDYARLAAETCNHLRDIPDYTPTSSSFISHEAADLNRPRVAALKAQGATILCWTIRSPAAEAKARRFADNITFEGYRAKLTQ